MKKKDLTRQALAGRGAKPGKEALKHEPSKAGLKPPATSNLPKSCLADIFEIAMDGIFVIDLKGRYREVNPAGCEMFGYARDEFLACDVRLLLFPEDVEEAFKRGEEHWRKGAFIPEYRMRKKDGSEVWVEMTIRPLEAGGEQLVVGIKRDITARRRAAISLKEERDRAQKYLDVAGVMLILIDKDQTVRLINKRGCEILGCEEGEIAGRNWFDNFIPADSRERMRAVFRDYISGHAQGAAYFENRVMTKSGEEKLLAWHNTVLRGKDGEIYATLSSGEDITERKKAEEKVSALKEFYENIVETAPLGILVFDSAFTVRSWNRYLEEYTSIRKEEIIGKNLFEAYPSLAANGWDVNYRLVIETGEPFSKDDYKFIKRVGPDKGKVVYQRCRILPLRDGGRVSGAITILEDVTVRIHAESKYSTMIRTAMDGFMIIGPLGHIVDVNEAYCRLTGYDRRELLAKGIWDLEALEKPEDVALRINRIMEAGQERLETRHRRKDGSIVDLDVSVNFTDMAGGMFFVFYRDITERKKMEDRLRTLSYGIEHNPTPVMIANIKGEIEYVNPRFCEDTGYGREELVGNSVGMIGSDVHPPEFFEKMWDTVASGEVWMGDVCNRRKNGEKFWELKTIAPLKNAEGVVTHFISIKIDDIESARALEALRRSEEQYRSLVDNLNVGVFRMSIGPECRFLQLNPAIMHIFGYSRAEDLLSADFQTLFKNADEKNSFIGELVRSAGSVKNRTYQLKKNDGTPIWASVSAKAQHDGSGAIKWIDGVIEDITERKLLEDRLHELSVMDELTGLYNRRGFLTLAEQELKIARRLGNEVILFFADLDGMKEINDTFGHKEGDMAIIDAAGILRESFRESDIIARIGGDEFVVLVMQNTDIKCEILNGRLQEKINEFNEKSGRPYKVSISFGIATTEAEDTPDIDELISRADKLMYEQKRRKQRR